MTGVAVETQAAQAVNVSKFYGTGAVGGARTRRRERVLRTRPVHRRHGPSGSGKSTLMQCMAGLDRPTSGAAYVGGEDIGKLDDAGLTRLRRDRIGFVFQYFNLVPTLTAAENITLPVALAGRKVDQDWFTELTGQLSIADRLKHKPEPAVRRPAAAGRVRAGAGQQAGADLRRRAHRQPGLQRIRRPARVPRSSVDEHGQSIVMVTHDPRSAAYADRVVFLADGAVVSELRQPTADSVLERMRTLGG